MQGDLIAEITKKRLLLVLRETARGGWSHGWYEGETADEYTKKAARELLHLGLLERDEGYRQGAMHPFRLTERGDAFFQDVIRNIGIERVGGVIDINWGKTNRIEFPLSNRG